MALNAYLTLKGQKQGPINGSVTQKGRENSIAVHAFDHAVISPRDPLSGLPTGKRMHKPFVVTIELDKSAPPLWNAFVNYENLTSWVLQCWSPAIAIGPAAGIENLVYTITLANASIASIEEVMADNQLVVTQNLPLREEVTFTYQRITWTWTDGGITASDDWESPV